MIVLNFYVILIVLQKEIRNMMSISPILSRYDNFSPCDHLSEYGIPVSLNSEARAYTSDHYEADALIRRIPVLSAATTQKDSGLLALPNELFLQILGQIPRSDLEILKLTCKDLYFFIARIKPYVRAPLTRHKTFTLSPALPQHSSLFFRLPKEVRDQIFAYIGSERNATRLALQTCKDFYANLIAHRFPELKQPFLTRRSALTQNILFNLPKELFQLILNQLKTSDLLSIRAVCSDFNRRVTKSPSFVVTIDRRLAARLWHAVNHSLNSKPIKTIFQNLTVTYFHGRYSPLRLAPQLLPQFSFLKALNILTEQEGLISRTTYRIKMLEIIHSERVLRYMQCQFTRLFPAATQTVTGIAYHIFRSFRQPQTVSLAAAGIHLTPLNRPVNRPIGPAALQEADQVSEDPEDNSFVASISREVSTFALGILRRTQSVIRALPNKRHNIPLD